MKNLLYILLSLLIFSASIVHAEEIKETPEDIKNILKTQYPTIEFKIDNSFMVENEIFLPLFPPLQKLTDKTEILFSIPDGNYPKLIWFNNDIVYAKLLKSPKGTKLIDINEIPEKHRETFKSLKLPSDLVVPKGFNPEAQINKLLGKLNDIKGKLDSVEENSTNSNKLNNLEKILDKQEKTINKNDKKLNNDIDVPENKISLNAFLTSPDSGKIIHIDFNDTSKIRIIETKGIPWDIKCDRENSFLYISDLAKNTVYKAPMYKNDPPEKVNLQEDSRPKNIYISFEKGIQYILECAKNHLKIYSLSNQQEIGQISLLKNPASFAILFSLNLVAITYPNENLINFYNLTTKEETGKLKLEGNPYEIISDEDRKQFYVTLRNNNSIAIVDAITQTYKEAIETGKAPTSLCLHPNKKNLYVGNGKSDTISIINLEENKIIHTLELPIETQFPSDLEITSNGKWLITTSESTGTISIFDLSNNTLFKTIDIGHSTHSLCLVE